MSSSRRSVQNEKVLTVIWHGLKTYLGNWRNLLGHALLGIVFVVAAIWAPVPLWIKLTVIACLIAFNIVRMRLAAKQKAAAKTTAGQPTADTPIQEGENP